MNGKKIILRNCIFINDIKKEIDNNLLNYENKNNIYEINQKCITMG